MTVLYSSHRKPAPSSPFVRLPELLKMVPVTKSTIYNWIRIGEFPKQRKIGHRASAWNRSEVQKWVAEKMENTP
jgi:prophage regulatory protein